MNEATTALILAGSGYNISIAPEAIAKRDELLATSGVVTIVSSNDESADAQRVIRSLASMRNMIDKSRKEVKEPVNRIGKLIDKTAADFLESVSAEESRIRVLVGAHAAEVEEARREAARKEREKFDAALKAKRDAEIAAEKAASSNSIADAVALHETLNARQEALVEKLNASDETAANRVAQGVRFALDFEVVSARQLLDIKPDLVEITVKRADTLAWLKVLKEEGSDLNQVGEEVGLRVFEKPIVSSR